MRLFKYRFLQTVRDRAPLFWALLFPLIMATFFYLSFWSMSSDGLGDGEATWSAVPVAVHDPGAGGQDAAYFREFLRQMDRDLLDIRAYDTEAEKLAALADDHITGVFYVDAEPSLKVSRQSINASVLQSLLDAYTRNADILRSVMRDHPEKVASAALAISAQRDHIVDVDLGGKTMNPNIAYFFALIAYTCLSGAYMGVSASFQGQANLSALGSRRSVTPTSKLRLVLTDLAALVIIHFFNIMVLTLYIRYALQIPLGIPMARIAQINLMGSVVGVSIGIILGCTSKAGMGMKMGLCVLASLFPAFLAGLMYAGMKNIIEQHAPIVNRLNPAAVLADTYYSLSVFDDMARFHRNMLILLAMSAILVTVAFVQLRRERYDSI
ncbi:MAG: ABC transporter permease [Oscillospiraceae bacterium]|jgi:ABC-2 type transport system permease protein|nr:ABC transporter permease [Oscillospiraceae bacterium]